MLTGFPHVLKRYGLHADVRVVMDLYRVMEMGLVNSLGSLFDTAQYLVCKSRRDHAPYTLAFWDHFLGIDTTNHRSVDAAVRDSAAFEHWLSQKLETGKIRGELDYQKLIDQFLNETLKSDLSKNIQEEIDAREHLAKDNPDLVDRGIEPPPGAPPNVSDKMVDYSGIPLEELKERMKRVMEQQKTAHSGGGHWVGSHGHSPYGHSGSGLHGIRVGGPSHAGTARKVLGDPEYYPVDLDAPITDDNMDAALQALRHLKDIHPDRKLDVPMTVEESGKNAGIVVPFFLKEQQDRTKIMLILDNGGNSMWVHTRKVQRLFSKMKRRFPQDLKTFYFHNAVYDQVYEDEARRKPVLLRSVKENSPEYRVFFVGDAYMGPHELLSPYGSIEFREESPVPSLNNLKELHHHFPYMVWINPTPKQYWNRTVAPYINEVMHMEPLTINGILGAARHLEQIRHY